jgi:nicotinamidase-related amidase
VPPYTTITAAQVRSGQFTPRDGGARTRVLAYLDALEARGRYTLMVWPEHCRIGTWGHLVHPAVQAACDRWESSRLRQVRHVLKGQNSWTEHYSAFEAEVPDEGDARTQLNRELLSSLDPAGTLLVAGEAASHCVLASVRDLVEHLPGGRPERMVLLTDCMSPVAGFESQQQAFLERMAALGLQLRHSTDR